MTKTCSMCRQSKGIDEFCVRRASPDGRSYLCRQCQNEKTRRWRAANPSAHREWYLENRSRKALYWKQWRSANADRVRQTYRVWAKGNPATVNALIARRNAAKLRATPAWADRTAMRSLYKRASELSKRTGTQHDVDHIVPLRSPVVCGLHCEHNLQILTHAANLAKSNVLLTEPVAC